MNKITISSAQTFISMLVRNPQLQKLSAFQHLTPVLDELSGKKPCTRCNAKVIKDNRKIFESAITGLSETDKVLMKKILNASEICYYSVNAKGTCDVTCF